MCVLLHGARWRVCQTRTGKEEHDTHERAHVHLCTGSRRGGLTMATGERGGGMRALLDTGARADSAARASTRSKGRFELGGHRRASAPGQCQHVSIDPGRAAIQPQRRRL